MTPLTRTIRLDRDIDLLSSFALHRRGPYDPTLQIARHELWRASLTPEGSATVHLTASGPIVTAEAWGSGASWAIDALGRFVGVDDDPDLLVPSHPVIDDLKRRLRGQRIGRTDRILEALIPAILEQKITSNEAHRSFRKMTYAWGEPAPGPVGLRVPVDPARLAATPYYEFHRFGIERRRADVIRAVSMRASRLEETTRLPADAAARGLRAFAGIGPWTVAEVTARAFGDPDAVPVGDFHVPHLVAHALAGEPRATDERMLELLAPYEGQRGRVIRLIEAGTDRLPRRAPRRRSRSIAGI